MDTFNTMRELGKLSSADTLVSEAVLEAMLALYQDVYNQFGTEIENGTVDNYETLAFGLCDLADMLCALYSRHKSAIAEHAAVDFPSELETVRTKTKAVKERLSRQRELQAQLDSRKQELKKDLASAQELDRKAKQTQERIDNLTRQLNQLETVDLKKLTDEEAALETKKQKLDTQVQAARQQKRNLDNAIAAHNSTLLELANVNEDIAAKEKELTKSQTVLDQAKQKRDELQEQITKANTEAEAFRKESVDLSPKAEAATALRNTRQQERDALASTAETATKEAEALEREAGELRAAQETAEAAAETAKADIEGLKGQIETARETGGQMILEVAQLRSTLETEESGNEAFRNTTLKDAQDRLGARRAEMKQMKKQVADLEKQFKDLDVEYHRLDQDVRNNNIHLITKRDELSKKRKAYTQQEDEMKRVQADLDKTTEGLGGLIDSIRKANERLASLKPEELKAQYEQELNEINKKIEDAKQTARNIESKKQELTPIEEQVTNLKGQYSELETSFRNLQGELSGLTSAEKQEKIRYYRNRIPVLEQVRNSLNQDSALFDLESSFDADASLNDVLQKTDEKLSFVQQCIQLYLEGMRAELEN